MFVEMITFIKRIVTSINDFIYRLRFRNKSDDGSTLTSKNASSITNETNLQNAIINNPYLQSKALWNELHGDVESRLKLSVGLNFLLGVVLVIALIGIVKSLASNSAKPVPFIIHGNEVVSAASLSGEELNTLKPNLALFFAKSFIQTARSVSTDGTVNASHQVTAFSLVGGAASTVLEDFYESNDPDTIAKHVVKHIHITSVLASGPGLLTIRWQEVSRNSQSGEWVSTEKYIAQIEYRYQKPSTDETVLKVNPLGFYIRDLTWSREN